MNLGAKLTEIDEGQKNATSKVKATVSFLSAIEGKGISIFEIFDIEVDNLQYEALITRSETHFLGRENITIMRHRFLSNKQQRGGMLSDFDQRVVNHSHSCQLGALREDMAIHVVINRVKDEKLMSELLQVFDINMDRLMTNVLSMSQRSEPSRS